VECDEVVEADLMRHRTSPELIRLEGGVFVAPDDDEILLVGGPPPQVAILCSCREYAMGEQQRRTDFGAKTTAAGQGLFDLSRPPQTLGLSHPWFGRSIGLILPTYTRL
jgi:hypothetical protein